MLAGSMFIRVRLFIRSFVRPSFTKCTIIHSKPKAGNRSTNFCIFFNILACSQGQFDQQLTFIQIVNILNLHFFKGQRFKLNTLGSSYVKCAKIFIGMMDLTNCHYVKGFQEAQLTIPVTKICQAVLA